MTIDQYETVAAQPESLVTSLTVPLDQPESLAMPLDQPKSIAAPLHNLIIEETEKAVTRRFLL